MAMSCASQPSRSPDSYVRQLAQAVAAADAHRVHALLDKKSQRLVTVAAVRRMLIDGGAELQAQAHSTSSSDADIRMKSIHSLTTLEVVRTQEGFAIETDGFALRGGPTPRQTLNQLQRALVDRNEIALLLLLSQSSRDRLERKLDGLAHALQSVSVNDIRIGADRATVRLHAGHRVELRREGGVWKVQDFE